MRTGIRYRVSPGGQKLAYVDGARVLRELNLAFGRDRDFEVKDGQVISGPDRRPQVVVLAQLTCRLPDGRVVVKEDFGSAGLRAAGGIQVGDVIAFGERPRTP